MGVALAFGVTQLTMCYDIGHLSGCLINPAVTFGLTAAGRFPARDLLPYAIAQVLGGIAAGAVLYLIASAKAGFRCLGGLRLQRYGAHSSGGYSLQAALVCELVMTGLFVFIIMGATDGRASAGFAALTIGFALTLIHLISIPVTNTSMNPAHAARVALFQGSWAIDQLWLFWLAPVASGIVGGLAYRFLFAASNSAPR